VSLGQGVVRVVVEAHVGGVRYVVNSRSWHNQLVVVDRSFRFNLIQALFGVVILVPVGVETEVGYMVVAVDGHYYFISVLVHNVEVARLIAGPFPPLVCNFTSPHVLSSVNVLQEDEFVSFRSIIKGLLEPEHLSVSQLSVEVFTVLFSIVRKGVKRDYRQGRSEVSMVEASLGESVLNFCQVGHLHVFLGVFEVKFVKGGVEVDLLRVELSIGRIIVILDVVVTNGWKYNGVG